MTKTPASHFARLMASLGLLILALFLVAWIGSALPAQDRGKSNQKEEEEEPPTKATKKQGKKPPKEEEEETGKSKNKPLIRVGDEDDDKPAGDKDESGQTSDLAREAEKAKNPVVRDLFRSLRVPHDVVTGYKRIFIVEPIPQYVGNDPQFKDTLTLKIYDNNWKQNSTYKFGKSSITAVDPYEHVALTKVEEFLSSGLDRDPQAQNYLPRMQMLEEAEKVLSAVIRFHESARLRGLREGAGWDDVKKSLTDKLQVVQLDQLSLLTDAKKWTQAFELATRLMEKYSKETRVQERVSGLIAASAGQSIDGKDFKTARQQLLLLESQFAHTKEIDAVRDRLRRQAQAIVDDAAALEKKGETQEAITLLQSAEAIYPRLPGLHDHILHLSNKYPVLYVGVRDLPEQMVPGLAFTDAEKQAVELQFESLVKLTFNLGTGQRYETSLAGDMPRLTPLGRRFQLLRNANWSNGKLVTATDVRNTVRLLSDPKWPGYVPEWAEFMAEGARLAGDQFQISLTMRQGYVDPLSFMDFKILPDGLTRAALDNFGKAPVGSGPFKLDKEKGKAGEDVAFVANPYYADREGKIGLPRVREIHFVVSKDPARELGSGQLHLLLDVPTSKVKELASLPNVTVTQPLRNRRIYFLAVNNHKNALHITALRRAIAHAIDRDKILTTVFRDGQIDVHRPLNGPYPPSSWACDSNLPADPFSLEKAKAFADNARKERPILGTITLKYPDDDPAVKQACEMIQKQVQEAGIKLDLTPRPRRQLHHEVEDDNNYDLAYYSWDFADESYWLWPLFDPAAAKPGGRNFLGYQNDDLLSSYFRKTMTHREFPVVKHWTHEIHDRLYEQMPFIPLWQLDTQFAYHNSLTLPPDIDPLLIFTDADGWKLEKR